MNVQMDTFDSYLVPEVRRKQFNKGVKVHHIIILSTSSTQLQKKGDYWEYKKYFLFKGIHLITQSSKSPPKRPQAMFWPALLQNKNSFH